VVNDNSQILVRTITKTSEDAQGLAKAILNFYSDSNNIVMVNPGVKVTDDEEDYFTLVMRLFVDTDSIATSLSGLDAIKAGYFPGCADIDEDAYSNLKYEVIHNISIMCQELVQTNKYLLNKIQEQTKTIDTLECEVRELNQQFIKIANILTGHQERYESMQAYIHSYIDLTAMSQVVTALAQEVDPDILDDFPMVTIH
jgi:hypothetical protein